MEYSQATATKQSALINFIEGKLNGEEKATLEALTVHARPGTLAATLLADVLTNHFDEDNSGYLVNNLWQCVYTAREINGLYTVLVRYMEAKEAAAAANPSEHMKAAADALTDSDDDINIGANANQALAARCMTIIKNPDAMAELLKEAVTLFAKHNNTDNETVLLAYKAGHLVAVKDLDRLIQQSVIELAKASFTWVKKELR